MRNRLTTLFVAALALLSLNAVQPVSAVVNGRAATAGQFPFMAAIQTRGGSTFCGGSVVANDWVLTAAHCVMEDDIIDYRVAKPETLRVVTGRTNLSDTSTGQVHDVDVVSVHPSYDGAAYDVAMLHLKTTTSSPVIRLAGSGDNDLEAHGTAVTVAGWGDQTPTYGALSTNQLRYTNLEVVNDDACADRNLGLHKPSAVCAAEFLTDSCHGDSGGPLWGVKAGVKVQIGVVSYGTSCAVPEFPGVYSEVNNSSISSFIATAIASR